MSHSTRESVEAQKKRFAGLVNVLERWFTKWADTFPTHQVTQMQMATYLESFDDLTPERLEMGCREATRVAEQFPKPGHIRAAINAIPPNEKTGYEWMLNYDTPGEVERIKRQITHGLALTNGTEPAASTKKFNFPAPTKTIEEQKEELRKRGLLH